MTDFMITQEYFANSYWGQWYWGGIGIKHAEVLRATVILQRLAAGSVKINRVIADNSRMNRVVTDSYEELEEV